MTPARSERNRANGFPRRPANSVCILSALLLHFFLLCLCSFCSFAPCNPVGEAGFQVGPANRPAQCAYRSGVAHVVCKFDASVSFLFFFDGVSVTHLVVFGKLLFRTRVLNIPEDAGLGFPKKNCHFQSAVHCFDRIFWPDSAGHLISSSYRKSRPAEQAPCRICSHSLHIYWPTAPVYHV